jgi:hypothetical protein
MLFFVGNGMSTYQSSLADGLIIYVNVASKN